MHSFHPSRGRVLLEVFCALAVVASMVGAWRQTGATAFLLAAVAVALLAMIRLFDFQSKVVAVVYPDVDAGVRDEIPTPLIDLPSASQTADVDSAKGEGRGSRTGSGRRKGGSRKGNGRRASVKELAAPEQSPDVAGPETASEDPLSASSDTGETSGLNVDQPAAAEFAEEPAHVPHAPLFEPEPFVRMQRQAFGRRGRL